MADHVCFYFFENFGWVVAVSRKLGQCVVSQVGWITKLSLNKLCTSPEYKHCVEGGGGRVYTHQLYKGNGHHMYFTKDVG